MKVFILLVTLPILCIAQANDKSKYTEEPYPSTSNNDHYHFTSDGSESSSEYSTSEATSTSFPRSCWNLTATPSILVKSRDVIDNKAKLVCTCEVEGINEDECPHWTGVYKGLHSYTRTLSHDQCTVTLTFEEFPCYVPWMIQCTDVMSGQFKETRIHLGRSVFGEPCISHETECAYPFSCTAGNSTEHSTCLCPYDKPVYSTGKCYPEVKLSELCDLSIQCKASDKNSYCLSPDGKNGTLPRCICGPGYEIGNDGTCVCEDCGLKYVYSCTKRYYIVFYVLLALSLLFILIGLLNVCLLHRRAIAKSPGVVVSTRPEDSNPNIETENPKEKK